VPIPELVVDVTHPSQLDQVKAGLSFVTALAVDVEADSMHHFQASLCWVQLGTDVDIWLVDTLAPGVGIGALAEVFADPSRTKYFHAAGGDLQYLAEAGVRVAGLFDTHRAATLLGWPKCSALSPSPLQSHRFARTPRARHQSTSRSNPR
jgi:ribonuclease D